MNQVKWLDTAVFYNIYPQSYYDSNADGIGDFYAACMKALDLGQSVDFLRYSELAELRKKAQGGC